ncbi:MAG: DUF2953 domain-containing protein [Paraclostridium sp.]
MENNINMDYKNLIITVALFALFIFLIFSIIFLFLKIGFNIILSSRVRNKEVEIKLSIICFFNLINITKVIYPVVKTSEVKNNKKKHTQKNKEGIKNKLDFKVIDIKDLGTILKLIKKINIVEIYSDLEYGFEMIEITSFVYFLMNVIYGNIFNYFISDKIYLNVKPCYTNTYIDYTGRVHIKPTIKDIMDIIITLIKIYIKVRKYSKVNNNKEEDIDEISKFYKKFNGYNSGVN